MIRFFNKYDNLFLCGNWFQVCLFFDYRRKITKIQFDKSELDTLFTFCSFTSEICQAVTLPRGREIGAANFPPEQS